MATRRQYTESELRVLKEAVASAVHELSQPLNVVNLLADNALEDISILQEDGIADGSVLQGLRRRLESIVERAEKASDIARWIRAFAVEIDEEATDFDPEAVVARVIGIFGNDLRVAGIDLVGEPATGRRIAIGNEGLLGFALTETLLWLSKELPRPVSGELAHEAQSARVHVRCLDDAAAGMIVVAVDGMVAAEAAADSGIAAEVAPQRAGARIPAALPLLSLIGQEQGCSVAMIRTTAGSTRIRASLPRSTLLTEGASLGFS